MRKENSTKKIKVLAIAGSLRKNSYNKLLLKVAKRIAPENINIDIFDLAPIPLYNMDLETIGVPQAVHELRSAIGQADALLFAIPEHNGTISAVLKNAIEWASRRNPAYQEYTEDLTPFFQKPVGLIGASTSHFATIRAQTHFLYLCTWLQMLPMSKPSLMLANAQNCFNEQGELINEKALSQLQNVIQSLYNWSIQHGL